MKAGKKHKSGRQASSSRVQRKINNHIQEDIKKPGG